MYYGWAMAYRYNNLIHVYTVCIHEIVCTNTHNYTSITDRENVSIREGKEFLHCLELKIARNP